MVRQHGPFSLHTMLEGPWLPKTAFPTPMGRPLDESQGSSLLWGHGSWFVGEVALIHRGRKDSHFMRVGSSFFTISSMYHPHVFILRPFIYLHHFLLHVLLLLTHLLHKYWILFHHDHHVHNIIQIHNNITWDYQYFTEYSPCLYWVRDYAIEYW